MELIGEFKKIILVEINNIKELNIEKNIIEIDF